MFDNEDFYLSKRAKDGEYLEKKEEESGNITYVYSEKHIKERNKKKAKKLMRLSKSLKNMRAQVKKDISSKDDRTRLAAISVALMDETYERVGNRYSAESMRHYGVTTWLVKHVKFSGSTARIKYVGKSGVKQDKLVKTPKVVSALKKLCSGKKPSDLVFELDDFVLTDNNVNQYLRPFNITAKDIRGLHANVEVRKQLQKMKKGKDEKERKQNFKDAVEEAAKIVGHKASTLKNQYLIPGYEEKYVTKGEIIGPKTASINLQIIKQAQHEGAMLAIMAPTNIKKELDISKECRPTFHLTLLYLGKAKDLSEIELNAIQRAVKNVCEKHSPIDMEITGAGVFNAGEDGVPSFVIPNGKGLSALQSALEEAVGNIIELPSDHGWVPHMTVSYSDDPDLPEFSNLKWKADKVRFQVGDKKRADIPLGKKASILSKQANIQMACPLCKEDVSNLTPEKTPAGLYKMLTCPHCKGGFYPQDALLSKIDKQTEKPFSSWIKPEWYLIDIFGLKIGYIKGENNLNLVVDRIKKQFIENGKIYPFTSMDPLINNFYHTVINEIEYNSYTDDSKDEHIFGYGDEIRKELESLINSNGPYFEKKRKKVIDDLISIEKVDETPPSEAVIAGGLPTLENAKKSIEHCKSQGKVVGLDPAKLNRAFRDFGEPIISKYVGKVNAKIDKKDPDKLADDMEQDLTDQEYEELIEKEYAEMEREEQERYDSMTDEEREAEEKFWDNYNKEFEAKELERQNRPKRKRSELTYNELEMLAEMDPEERNEWLEKNVEGNEKFALSKRASSFWKKPRLEDESSELSRVAIEEGLSYDSLKRSFKHGVMRPLDRKIWEHLDNTDSLDIRTIDEAVALANNYGKNWEPIKAAFDNQTSLPAPVVLELNDGSITLVGGNTRLAFARAYHVKPEVYWIKETELF